MASLYSNENFPKRVVEELRRLGHDVLTCYEAGRANQKIPDDKVLQFAISQNRVQEANWFPSSNAPPAEKWKILPKSSHKFLMHLPPPAMSENESSSTDHGSS
jgi:hypothetical protein